MSHKVLNLLAQIHRGLMTISITQLREDWLMRAVAHLEPIFQRSGYQIPTVRVSIGFPSTGAKSMHLGQCWGSKASEDGVNQIFIAPNQADPVEVLDTLTHELVHAVDDCKSGHGEGFKKIATDVGLKGPIPKTPKPLHNEFGKNIDFGQHFIQEIRAPCIRTGLPATRTASSSGK